MERKIVKDLIKFKNWADDQYLDILEKINSKQQEFTLPDYDRNIKQILFHIYEVQWFWYHFITDKDYTNEPESDQPYSLIIQAIRKLNEDIEEFCRDKDINKKLTLQFSKEDKEVITNPTNIILNFIVHNAHHRGQLAILLRSQNIIDELPETDFNPYIYKMQQI